MRNRSRSGSGGVAFKIDRQLLGPAGYLWQEHERERRRDRRTSTYVKPFALDRISRPATRRRRRRRRSAQLCAPITSSLYDRLVNVRIREIDGPLYATAEHMHTRARARTCCRTNNPFDPYRSMLPLMRPRIRSIFLYGY